ncbi:MAG TPA: pyridoxamine 5'-phosphate oxidase [Nitriliruptorales bacterium]|nr:pyridoxamine 5'-phosphate oxidase [Nitriliruptorales bacterium]
MPLHERDLDPDPFQQFATWYAAAQVAYPDAMALATATPDGRPSARMVLLKGHGPAGFVFYTDTESRKGRELAANPHAALLFHWDERQVRIEGRVETVTAAAADDYWRTRPLGSRLSAVASRQSQSVPNRRWLEEEVARVRGEHGDDPARPARWGGYRLVADVLEFWQHGEDRLHDRFRYERVGDAWRRQRLSP